MIQKQEFYHGVAVLRIVDDPRCRAIQRQDGGYVVNESAFVFIKYTTKQSSPWRFTFDQDDLDRMERAAHNYAKVVIVFVCGGDGVCALLLQELDQVLGREPGWVSAVRRANESYAVAGSAGSLERKIPLLRWPELILNSQEVYRN